MQQNAFYEESATCSRSVQEARLSNILHIVGMIAFLIAAFLLVFSLMFVPNIIANPEIDGGSKAFFLVLWFGIIVLTILIGVFLWWWKRRYNVSYDYIFVEDELRITKVFNGKKRKHLVTLKTQDMQKIGYCEADSYDECLNVIHGKKPKLVTSNQEPSEEKQFIYILYHSVEGNDLYVLECRQMLLEYVVRAAGIQKFTKQ